MPEVLRSLADPGFLAELVRREWGVDAESVVLHRSLVNDVYRVEPGHFLKVFRHGWRTLDEVAWECDLLDHLNVHDVPVATVTPRSDGTKAGVWNAPEGPRPLVLMPRIPGQRPTQPFPPETHREHGRIIARIHEAGRSFRSPHRRPPRDLASMLDEPLAAILPHLGTADRDRAVRLAALAHDGLTRNPPTRGLIHGDATMDNVIEPAVAGPRLMVFDFDLAGEGYLATDFLFEIDNFANFLAGYREVRPVPAEDLAAAPWLRVAAILENLCFHALVKPGWHGTESTTEGWLDAAVAQLRKLAAGLDPQSVLE